MGLTPGEVVLAAEHFAPLASATGDSEGIDKALPHGLAGTGRYSHSGTRSLNFRVTAPWTFLSGSREPSGLKHQFRGVPRSRHFRTRDLWKYRANDRRGRDRRGITERSPQCREGAFVRDSLMQGKLLLVIAAQGRELPAQLLRAWDNFHDDPQCTSSGVGQFIHFNPIPTPRASPGLGMLGIIVPSNYEGERLEPRIAIHLSPEDMAPPASPHAEVRILGRRATQCR